ncbi:hypothetical protein PU634_11330 [Oceanimonas pelagia]|uniref:Uncharacterized protein n=1 Tax=Oceanimonas pelagia TaxID=3028314 RepID=A0AA50KMA1_9GAMM|nr:hypothetical protein [Oceanimonas pelagia]WMC09708.1 hypothetical protein PU634_11330 [Oceanimonas pelagia]
MFPAFFVFPVFAEKTGLVDHPFITMPLLWPTDRGTPFFYGKTVDAVGPDTHNAPRSVTDGHQQAVAM